MEQYSTPPKSTVFELTSPAPHVLLVTINRERQMNSVPWAGHYEGEKIFQWFDDEPDLRVAIVTGKGNKAFCCGADLKEQAEINANRADDNVPPMPPFPPGGFAGLTTRVGKKPVIAAVNGFAYGGGFEIALNW